MRVAGGYRVAGQSYASQVAPTKILYVATGAEGSDFSVTIPTAMTNDSYGVTCMSQVGDVPAVQCPDVAAGDRTTTAFRVVTSADLTAGDTLEFNLFPQ